MISKLQPFLQFRDKRYDSENTPAKDIDSNPTEEEEFEAVLDEDMYCIDDTDTINSVEDESLDYSEQSRMYVLTRRRLMNK